MTMMKFNDERYEAKALTYRKCKCGHSVDFYKSKIIACTWCGRLIYASPKIEFKERLRKAILHG